MNSTKSILTIGGTNFLNQLFLIFLVLKLTSVITWSWWWITAPLWMPIAIIGFILTLVFVCAMISESVKNKKARW